MALLKANRSAQWPLVASFTLNFDDTMVNVAGTTLDFGKTNAAATVVEVINLPPGSVVTGGEWTTETAFTHAFTILVGDSGVAGRYLGSTNVGAAARTALVPTGFQNVTGLNIRLSFTNTTAGDIAGKGTLRVEYIVAGRSNEVQVQ